MAITQVTKVGSYSLALLKWNLLESEKRPAIESRPKAKEGHTSSDSYKNCLRWWLMFGGQRTVKNEE